MGDVRLIGLGELLQHGGAGGAVSRFVAGPQVCQRVLVPNHGLLVAELHCFDKIGGGLVPLPQVGVKLAPA
jgi:hypothetical protein